MLQESLDDTQQNVPRDHLQLLAILLDEPGDGEDDLVGHHFVGARHGLHWAREGREGERKGERV